MPWRRFKSCSQFSILFKESEVTDTTVAAPDIIKAVEVPPEKGAAMHPATI